MIIFFLIAQQSWPSQKFYPMYIYVFFQAYAMFPLNKATAFDVLNFRDLNIDVAFV